MSVDTIYPFGDTLVYTITARSSFDFYIRIPSWTVLASSSISVDGKKAPAALTPDENSLQKVAVRSGKTTVKVKLGMEVNVVTRGSGGVAVYRGPLLYALDLEYSSESFQPLNWIDTQPLPEEEVSRPLPLSNPPTPSTNTNPSPPADPPRNARPHPRDTERMAHRNRPHKPHRHRQFRRPKDGRPAQSDLCARGRARQYHCCRLRGGVECDAGFARATAAKPRVCGREGQCDAQSVWDGKGAYGGVAGCEVLMWRSKGVFLCIDYIILYGLRVRLGQLK